MKLSLFFIAMELLTVLAYPVVFIYNKLHRLLRPYEIIPVRDVVVVLPVRPGR